MRDFRIFVNFQYFLWMSELKKRDDLEEVEDESESESEVPVDEEDRSEDVGSDESDGGGDGRFSGCVLPLSGTGKSGFLADSLWQVVEEMREDVDDLHDDFDDFLKDFLWIRDISFGIKWLAPSAISGIGGSW